jgi:hypothetical protein
VEKKTADGGKQTTDGRPMAASINDVKRPAEDRGWQKTCSLLVHVLVEKKTNDRRLRKAWS